MNKFEIYLESSLLTIRYVQICTGSNDLDSLSNIFFRPFSFDLVLHGFSNAVYSKICRAVFAVRSILLLKEY